MTQDELIKKKEIQKGKWKIIHKCDNICPFILSTEGFSLSFPDYEYLEQMMRFYQIW